MTSAVLPAARAASAAHALQRARWSRPPQPALRARAPSRSVRWPAPAGRWFCGTPQAGVAARSDYELYLVTDDTYLDGLFYDKIAAAVAGGVTCVQLRLKHASTATLVEWGHRVRDLTRQAGVPLIVDDRLDVALACDADGLHVGGEDLPWRTARRLLGPDRILGCSTYGRADLVREALHPEVRADYLGSGAIFATSTKHSSVPKGVEHLRGLRRLVAEEAGGRTVPVVAIGGVGLAAAGECVAAGADGVAAVSALLGHASAEGTRQAAAAMLAAVRGAARQGA